MEIKINRNPYNEKKPLFAKPSIHLDPGVTILVGCNGSGKSTLLHQIESHAHAAKCKCIHYDNEHQGGIHAVSGATYHGNFEYASSLFASSEGEKIHVNLAAFANRIGAADSMRRQDGTDASLAILLDGIDSGLDIAAIKTVKQDLFATVLQNAEQWETYIIATANTYAMAEGEQCLDASTCIPMTFPTYTSYADFIGESTKRKSKRYNKQ